MATQSFSTNGTSTWTAPTDINSVYVECWGAGGGGGGAGNDVNYAGGAGGGGGAYAAKLLYVTPGTNYTVVVGRGGAPGADSNAVGATGGVSWAINSASVIAAGGTGGDGVGGAGTGGTTAGSSGSTVFAGGNGAAAANVGVSTVKGGGGGGGAGVTAAGSNAGTAPNPGAGGSGNPGASRGAGGSGSNSAGTIGSAGTSAGGGGGGATTNTTPLTTIRAGGSGSDGYVLLSWNNIQYPVVLNNGSIDVMGSTNVVNPAFFPMSRSVAPTSGSFATLLPDPYFIQTSSADVTVSTNGVSSSVMNFTVPTRPEEQYYLSEALLGVLSATAATTAPRISVDRANTSDGCFTIKTATSLTAVAIINQGSLDARATASAATTVANNVSVPVSIRGIFSNSTSNGTFNNNILIETSASISVTARSASMFSNHFAGISSSLAPFTSSQPPIILVSGTLNPISPGYTIPPVLLPPALTLWNTQSLTTTVTNTSNVTFATIFTLRGMTDGKRYLVNHYLKVQTNDTGNGHTIRAVSASNFTGFLYGQGSAGGNNAAPLAASSSGSNALIFASSGVSSANSPRLFWGEYTLTKTAGQNPTIEIRPEVNTSSSIAQSGSLVMWRLIE